MRIIPLLVMSLVGCELEQPQASIDLVSKKDSNESDVDRGRSIEQSLEPETAMFYTGGSPHKLRARSRRRDNDRNLYRLATPAITATWATRTNTWSVGRAGTVEMLGSWAPETTFTWFADTEVLGAGPRVNLAAPLTTGTVNVRGCVNHPGEDTVCTDVPFTVVPALTEVVLAPVTTTGTWSGGRWIRISGQVKNMPAARPIVRLFVHTDVFYAIASAQVDAAGQFSIIIHTANNVDRVAAVAMAPTFDWTKAPGCNSNYCIGRRDVLTGRYLPVPIDEANVHAFAVYYAQRENAATAVTELKRRSMAVTVNGAMQPARFTRSELDGEACFVYDQALAAIVFVATGEQAAAQQVLNALVNTQRSDGSWYFAYRGNGGSDFPSGGDVRYTGAVAWVALAFNAYAQTYGLSRYAVAHNKLMDYLRSQMLDVDGARAIRFNPSDLNTTPWNEANQTALEHALDTYAAMIGYQRLTNTTTFATDIAGLEQYVANRWTGSDFTPGYMLTQGANTTELYLDTQSWSLLALGAQGSAYVSGLAANCAQLFEPAGTMNGAPGVRGYFHFRWRTGTAAVTPFVWTEGSAGMALAMQRYAPTTNCQGRSASNLVADLDTIMTQAGLPASTDNILNDFSESPATAGLAWYIFARVGVNPFRTWEPLSPVL